MKMAQVHGDPAEMRRFAASLRQFATDLDASSKRINHASKAVGSSWNDHEYRKFMQEWQRTLQSLHRFINEAPKYEKYVTKKAQALETYLRQGGI